MKKVNTAKLSSLRIIAGTWRRRKISFDPLANIRPTADRVRETLFNWLGTKIYLAKCLDVCAGSGILGFEALSRGAMHVDAIEQNSKVHEHIVQQQQLLKADNYTIYCANALDYLKTTAPVIYDIVFIDPPYDKNLLIPICTLLKQNAWLKPGSILYCEDNRPFHHDFEWLTNLKHAKAGQVYYNLGIVS